MLHEQPPSPGGCYRTDRRVHLASIQRERKLAELRAPTGGSLYRRKLESSVPAVTRGRGAAVAGCVSGEWRKRNEFCPPHPLHPSRRYRGRCDARFPPGKKSIAIRKLAPPNDAIYASLPPSLSSCASQPRIPRNSAAGDWRWRPRALRDKPRQHTPRNQTTPFTPTNTSSSSSRPRNFRGGIGWGWYGVSSASNAEAPLLPPSPSSNGWDISPRGRVSNL